MPRLIQPLPDGPLDLIGDVHGEIDALLALLHHLGVDVDRRRAERPLVFVGDLVDRGPDSVAVVELVSMLMDAGLAYAVLGNHELNILQGLHKEGNGWFFGHADRFHNERHDRLFASRAASNAERRDATALFQRLPLVLQRDDLVVAHAWYDPSVLPELPEHGDVAALATEAERLARHHLIAEGWLARARAELGRHHRFTNAHHPPTRPLPGTVAVALAETTVSPYKRITAGPEHELGAEEPLFFIGGKWRVTDRTRWWEGRHDGPAVVIGHYWRRRNVAIAGKRDVWSRVEPFAWAGPGGRVFCVDYSVGRRFLERWDRGPQGPFVGALAALRWPERVLVFDDHAEPVPTTGHGGPA